MHIDAANSFRRSFEIEMKFEATEYKRIKPKGEACFLESMSISEETSRIMIEALEKERRELRLRVELLEAERANLRQNKRSLETRIESLESGKGYLLFTNERLVNEYETLVRKFRMLQRQTAYREEEAAKLTLELRANDVL